jgi:hypothetical protein
MAKSLLQILKTQPAKGSKLPNQSGMAPHTREDAQKEFLKRFPISTVADPYGNDDAFSAKDVKVFDRAANRFGKNNVEFNQVKMQVLPGDQDATLGTAKADTGLDEAKDRKYLKLNPADRAKHVRRKRFEKRRLGHGITQEETIDEMAVNFKPGTRDSYASRRRFASKLPKNAKEPLASFYQGVRDIAKTSLFLRGPHEEIEESTLNESGPSRKHFREVANTVRAIEDPKVRQAMADHHAAIFAKMNPRFDHAKFHAAAGTQYIKSEETVNELSAKVIDKYERHAKAQVVSNPKPAVLSKRLSGLSLAKDLKKRKALREVAKYIADPKRDNDPDVQAYRKEFKDIGKKYGDVKNRSEALEKLFIKYKDKIGPYHHEETIDEMSQEKLQRYRQTARVDQAKHANAADAAARNNSSRQFHDKKALARISGRIKAGSRLSGKFYPRGQEKPYHAEETVTEDDSWLLHLHKKASRAAKKREANKKLRRGDAQAKSYLKGKKFKKGK